MTCGMLCGVSILSTFQLRSSYGLWFMIFWRFGGNGWLTDWLNNKGVCRTAPATLGLLTTWPKESNHVSTVPTMDHWALMWIWLDHPLPLPALCPMSPHTSCLIVLAPIYLTFGYFYVCFSIHKEECHFAAPTSFSYPGLRISLWGKNKRQK